MRAAVYERYGGPVVLGEMPLPILRAGQVLVRVQAASVNSWDWDLLSGNVMGRTTGPFGPPHRVLGADLAGVVEAVGEGASRFAPGDAVVGDISAHGWGGFGEFVGVPETALVHKPAELSFVEAAAVPQAGTLALQALRKRLPVSSGHRVLINGAGGGAGTFAIQLAKIVGAEVTAVDHADKFDLMRSLGADVLVDYRVEDFTAAGRRYDRVVDLVARHSMAAYRRSLMPDGTLVIVGGRVRTLLAAALAGISSNPGGQALGLLIWRPDTTDMAELLSLCASGAIRPAIDRVYPLGEVDAAVRRVGDGKSLGKVVIAVDA